MCIFCKIVNKEINAKAIYEDDKIIAFYDLHPKMDIHFLVIPKQHIESLLIVENTDSDILGYMLVKGSQLAKELGLQGFKTQINAGTKGGQEVFHLHMHFMGNK